MFKFINQIVINSGINVKRFLRTIRALPVFIADWNKYKRLSAEDGSMPLKLKNVYPILFEKYDAAGDARGHYFAQDVWAARKIYERNPKRHIDIGSEVRGFISSLMAFRKEVEAIDIRSLTSSVQGLTFIQDDATQLSQFKDNSLESISTLHAAEHFGLGRYGDPIDPRAHIKFIQALKRVLAPGGYLYFSVPTGRERVEFNAGRIFAPKTILELFKGLELVSFSGVKDDGNFYPNIEPNQLANEYMGCGMFEFRKP